MLKNRKRAIAKCPACRRTIFPDHPDGWCHKCGKPLPQEIKSKLVNPDSPAGPPADLIPTERIVMELRARAAWLRTVAGIVMGGIIVLTLVGIFIFLQAGYNAQQETAAGTMLRAVENIGEDLKRVKDSLKNKRESAAQTNPDLNPRAPTGGAPRKLEPDLDANQIMDVLNQIPSFEETVNTAIRTLREDLGGNNVTVPILVSTVSQRVGIIVLLIF